MPSVIDHDPSAADQTARHTAPPRHSRRLSDKILLAFHHACDQNELDVAEQLLVVLENMIKHRPVHPDQNRRRTMDGLIAAHERLWYLRHPELSGK